jgi:Hint domain/Ice-binding-like
MSGIDITNRGALSPYAVLAATGLTSAQVTTISNGTYGTSGGTKTGTFIGTLDNASAFTAQNELDILIDQVNTLRDSLPSVAFPAGPPYTLLPGKNYSAAGITIDGNSITLDAGGDSNAQFFIKSSGTGITFNNVPSIILANGAKNNNIFWLTSGGGNISFTSTPPPTIYGNFLSTGAISFANISNISGRLYAKATVSFTRTSFVDAATDVVCYAKGTLILTDCGIVPVEDIQAGDNVMTNGNIVIIGDNQYIENRTAPCIEPVLWMGKFKMHNLDSHSRPICIQKGALGENVPFMDLYVSPRHGLFIGDTMVAAKDMVNGTTIYQDTECKSVEYYHIECKNHVAIVANGALCESFRDGDNKHVFENDKKSYVIIPKEILA